MIALSRRGMKSYRSKPSPSLKFNHRTLCQFIEATDSLKFWAETAHDKNNKHLHKRAAFKTRWLKRKTVLLYDILYR